MSPATSSVDILRRLEALEKQNRQLRRCGTVVATLLAVVFLSAAQGFLKNGPLELPRDKVVQAEKIVLRDENGKQRAVLTMSDNHPQLALLDEDDKPRLILSASNEGAMVGFGDENGKLRCSLTANSEGGSLMFADKEGHFRASLFNLIRKGPGLVLQDQDGRLIFSAP